MNVKHFIVQSSKLNSQIYKQGGRGRGSVDVVQVVFLDAGVAVAAVLAFNAGNQPQSHRFLILLLISQKISPRLPLDFP